MASPFSHCHFCGAAYGHDRWPRDCSCGKVSYRNPLPVAVLLAERNGAVVLVQRTLTPAGYALPGGFVDHGESWQQAAARELSEETGATCEPDTIRHTATISAPDGTLLIFGHSADITLGARFGAATDETAGAQLVAVEHLPLLDGEIVFELHRQVLRDLYERRRVCPIAN